MMLLHFLFLILQLPLLVWGHGYMYEPPSRNKPNNIVTGNLNCGANGGKPGPIVQTYKAGQVIDVTIMMYQEHGGQFFWNLCPKSVGDDEGWDDACFKQYPLEARLEVRAWWPSGHEFNKVPQRGVKWLPWSTTNTEPKQCLQSH